jgi:hypothetical protein
MPVSIETIRAQNRARWKRWYAKPESKAKERERRARRWREDPIYRQRILALNRIARAKAKLAKLAAQAGTAPVAGEHAHE